MSQDPYKVLGVHQGASDAEIRSAYRRLAKELHPDLNPGDVAAEDRFKDVASAFAILGDPALRKRYDKGEIDATGAERPEHQFYKHHADTDGRHHYQSSNGFHDFVDLGDFFADAFAGGKRTGHQTRQRSMKIRGGNVRYQLDIDFLEAVTGATKRITMPDGRTLDVSIPAGIQDGQTMRLRGKGQPGINGGPAGDALVLVAIRSHPYFDRDGNTIILDAPIAIHEAVLGSKIEVPTIGGRVSLVVPKGATTGKVVRLKGRGIKTKTGTGDQLVRFRVMMPENVDEDLERFMKTWAEDHGYDPRAGWEKA